MIAALRAEFFAARRRPATWIVGGLWLALAVVFGMLVPVIVYEALDGSRPPRRPTARSSSTACCPRTSSARPQGCTRCSAAP